MAVTPARVHRCDSANVPEVVGRCKTRSGGGRAPRRGPGSPGETGATRYEPSRRAGRLGRRDAGGARTRGGAIAMGLLGKFADVLAKQVPSNAWRISMQRSKGVRIGQHVYLGYDVNIDAAYPTMVEIHDHARISHGVIILAHERAGDAWLDHKKET